MGKNIVDWLSRNLGLGKEQAIGVVKYYLENGVLLPFEHKKKTFSEKQFNLYFQFDCESIEVGYEKERSLTREVLLMKEKN